MIETIGRGVLNCQKLSGIRIVFYVAIGFDQQFVTSDKAATPAGHVKTLAGGMKLDSDFLRSRRGEEAQRLAFEYKGGVGRVVNHHDPAAPGELDYFGAELRRGADGRPTVPII